MMDFEGLDDRTKALMVEFTKYNYEVMFERLIQYLEGTYELTEHDFTNLENLHSDLDNLIAALEQ